MKVPRWKRGLGVLTARFWPTLALANGIQAEDVTRNPEVLANFWKDPLVHHVATARWFAEATAAQQRILAAAAQLDVPTLLLLAGADRIVVNDASSALADQAPRFIRLHRFDGLFHELFLEPEWPEVVDGDTPISCPRGRAGRPSRRGPLKTDRGTLPRACRGPNRLYFQHEREPPRRLSRKRARAVGMRAGSGARGPALAHPGAAERVGPGVRSGRRRAAAEAAALRRQRGRLLRPGPRSEGGRVHRPGWPGRSRRARPRTTPIRSGSDGGCSDRWAWPRGFPRCASACWPACPTSSAATSGASRPASTSSICSWRSCTTPACWSRITGDPAPVGRALRESLAFVDQLLAGVGAPPARLAGHRHQRPLPGRPRQRLPDAVPDHRRHRRLHRLPPAPDARSLGQRRPPHLPREPARGGGRGQQHRPLLRPGWTLVPPKAGLLVGPDRVPVFDTAS